VAISYKLFRAWVSEYQALPEFDANTMNTVGIQTITLQHEGWERDAAVSEPTET
jgi:phage tail-like protein